MSKCISINGEYSEHEPSNQEFVCGRCFAFDEDAVMAEVDSLRYQLAGREAVIEWARAFTLAHLSAILSASPSAVLADLKADVWDECLTAIEENEINTQQAREGNPYRKGAGQ